MKEAAGKATGTAVDLLAETGVVQEELNNQRREQQVTSRKEKISLCVVSAPVRSNADFDFKIVASVALEALLHDYSRMCSSGTGGRLIVYDRPGTGKSVALQGVARAKS
jgi:hypothetical protein